MGQRFIFLLSTSGLSTGDSLSAHPSLAKAKARALKLGKIRSLVDGWSWAMDNENGSEVWYAGENGVAYIITKAPLKD